MSPLRELRQELGLTQVEFAARLDIPVETYRLWDSGRRTVPIAVLARAAEVTGLVPGERLPLPELAVRMAVHVSTLRMKCDMRMVGDVMLDHLRTRAITLCGAIRHAECSGNIELCTR